MLVRKRTRSTTASDVDVSDLSSKRPKRTVSIIGGVTTLSSSCTRRTATDTPVRRRRTAALVACHSQKNVYQVARIFARWQDKNGQWHNAVSWKGYDEAQNTVEPDHNILDRSLIADYENVTRWKWEYKANDETYTAMNDTTSTKIDQAYQSWLASGAHREDDTFYYSNRIAHSTHDHYYTIAFSGACPHQTNPSFGTVRLCRRVPVSLSPSPPPSPSPS